MRCNINSVVFVQSETSIGANKSYRHPNLFCETKHSESFFFQSLTKKSSTLESP